MHLLLQPSGVAGQHWIRPAGLLRGCTALRQNGSQEQNGTVQMRIIFAVLVVTALFATPATMPQTAAPAQHTIPPPEARVDINHAGIDELMKVPGMTRTWASRIVRFRPYRTKQDLLDHGVLTGEVYDRIKDYVIAHREKE
jgi:DNA uptake protein ComE-like DNA-binding protein